MMYILDENNNPVPCSNAEEWNRWFRENERHVADDTVDGIRVSTVFIGTNHRYGQYNPPLLFETMIFGGKYDMYCERYETWTEAEIGHALALGLVSG